MKSFPFRATLACLLSVIGLQLSGVAQIAPNIDRSQNAGIDTLLYKTGARDIVTISGCLPAGNRFNPSDNPAIAALTAAMLDQGTTTRDKYAIAAQLESVGAAISFRTDGTMLNFNAKCLTKDVPLVISILAEQLRTPGFSADEFAKMKTQLAGSLQQALENTNARAARAFSQAIYPAGHPNYQPPIDVMIKAVNGTTLEQLKSFHAKYYGPAQMTFVAVGDLDLAAFKTALAKSFAGWNGGMKVKNIDAPEASPPTTPAGNLVAVNMADKTSITVLLGQGTRISTRHKDYYALTTATAILGSGFTGRLLANVRDREGLTYGIGARLAGDTYTDGDFRIIATFAPALLDKGIASTRRQLDEWYAKGVTAQELADRKTNLIGSYKVDLATTEGLASMILGTVVEGNELAFLDKYPSIIEALTLDQVNGAIKKHLDLSKMVMVEAGTLPQAK